MRGGVRVEGGDGVGDPDSVCLSVLGLATWGRSFFVKALTQGIPACLKCCLCIQVG